jgi:hypothetical protein
MKGNDENEGKKICTIKKSSYARTFLVG